MIFHDTRHAVTIAPSSALFHGTPDLPRPTGCEFPSACELSPAQSCPGGQGQTKGSTVDGDNTWASPEGSSWLRTHPKPLCTCELNRTATQNLPSSFQLKEGTGTPEQPPPSQGPADEFWQGRWGGKCLP